jgi:uncharacterized oxidoreductase
MEANTVLITGGASGIGLALAKRFASAGSRVIVCGRRAAQLEEAKAACPGLEAFVGDVSSAASRLELFQKVAQDYPEVNVLVNNAGIQNRPSKLAEPQDWEAHAKELEINLHAPIHMAILFIPHLLTKKSPMIVNVTSGLSFVPIAAMSTYCATKAGLHSFTMSLRHQLQDTPIKVVEMIPPAVNTDLGGKGLHNYGVPLDEYADDAFAHIVAGDLEFGYGFSERGRNASRAEINETFVKLNSGAH